MCFRSVRLQYSLIIKISLEGSNQCLIDFLNGNNNQGKIVCKTTTAGWVWLYMSSHSQTSFDLSGLNLVDFGLIWPH